VVQNSSFSLQHLDRCFNRVATWGFVAVCTLLRELVLESQPPRSRPTRLPSRAEPLASPHRMRPSHPLEPMRLLRYDEHGGLGIISFDDGALPPYAIQSHTRGADAE
jgi:hypothetical protein